jgi:7-carboxy-7-deazaguanine synthase
MKLSEHYVSVQGEGHRMGVFTQFVRFSGCNLRCPGWPCDTPYAIYPEQYKLDPQVDVHSLVTECARLRDTTGAHNVCITGGEPLVQNPREMSQFVANLIGAEFTIDLFTNGTKPLPRWATSERVICVMMDWKLPGSGEMATGMTIQNAEQLKITDGIKFVCTDEEDYNVALGVADELRYKHKYVGSFWLGVAASVLKEADLVEWVKRDGVGGKFRLNVQTHKFIFQGVDRGV